MVISQLFIINYSLFIKKGFLSVIHSSDCRFTVASGNRNRETGALSNVGTWGGCWSSSPVSGSANASNMEFNSSYVRPEQSNNRANGFSVRCVQHLPAVFPNDDAPPKDSPMTRNDESYRFSSVRSVDSAIH